MIKIEFDDIIFSLQKSGGASIYWNEIVTRMKEKPLLQVIKTKYSRSRRCVPVISNADIFHSSHFRFSLLSKAKNITTVHDLIYEKGLVENSLGSKLNLYERKLSYFTADAIICISENTKKDLLQIYPSLERRCPIHVVHHGINRHVTNIKPRDIRSKQDDPYLLYVGSRGGYKNFAGALEGYLLSELWREGVKLVCTGNKFNESELKLLKGKGLEKLVVSEEHVCITRMYELYSNAYCLLYTSSYEGFGLPPIEAMSACCPVIASNISSIPEVVGDAGILINPFDHENISKAILLLGNDKIRNELIDKGIQRSLQFSWDKSAESHYKVYKDISHL